MKRRGGMGCFRGGSAGKVDVGEGSHGHARAASLRTWSDGASRLEGRRGEVVA